MIRRIWAKAAKGAKANTTVVTASTASVDRDGDVLDQAAWQLDSFKANPVIPWNHDYSLPPVGRAVSVDVKDGKLTAEIEWDTKTEMGATVARQFAEGFLGAVSVGFIAHDRQPRKGLPEEDPMHSDRGNKLSGLELLEISAVVVPANPEAVAAKRWAKDSASIRDAFLELVHTDAEIRHALGLAKAWQANPGHPFDLPAADPATEWSFEASDADAVLGETPDWERFAMAHLIWDTENAEARAAYKLPIAKVVDGELRYVRAGIIAARSVLQDERDGIDVPDAVIADALRESQAILDAKFPEDAPPSEEPKGLRAMFRRRRVGHR